MISQAPNNGLEPFETLGDGSLATANARTGAIDDDRRIIAEGDTTTRVVINGGLVIQGNSVTAKGSELVASVGEGVREYGDINPGCGPGSREVERLVAVTGDGGVDGKTVGRYGDKLNVAGVEEGFRRGSRVVASDVKAGEVAAGGEAEGVGDSEVTTLVLTTW